MPRKHKVLFISSEVAPYAKTGGLADVSSALPKAIKKQNWDVEIVVPFYHVARPYTTGVKEVGKPATVALGGEEYTCRFFQGRLGRTHIMVTFVECEALFGREGLYGDHDDDFADNLLRFSVFSHAALEYAQSHDEEIDVVHCNDWQTGLVPALLHAYPERYAKLKTALRVMTIHNLTFQGKFPRDQFHLSGLPEDMFGIDGVEFYNEMSLLKAGVVYSDWITTVSEQYSREIQTEEYGAGFHEILIGKADRLVGIMNGVDYTVWNPERDKLIAQKYSVQDPSGKAACREDLLQTFEMDTDFDGPLIGMVTRLSEQKGIDLVEAVLDRVLGLGAKLILLGTGTPRYEAFFRDVSTRRPAEVGAMIKYDEAVAHKIEAGSDMFLMPSRFEPAGLNQLYSLAYGTIPIVRATGGLDDTVMSYDPANDVGNGFKFTEYSADALFGEISRAVDIFLNHKNQWKRLQERAMAADYSWKGSAKRYVQLYRDGLKHLADQGR